MPAQPQLRCSSVPARCFVPTISRRPLHHLNHRCTSAPSPPGLHVARITQTINKALDHFLSLFIVTTTAVMILGIDTRFGKKTLDNGSNVDAVYPDYGEPTTPPVGRVTPAVLTAISRR